MATCRSCGADIIWVATESGKVAPVDARPEKRYVLTEITRQTSPGMSAPLARLKPTYMSHFATCPNAAEHRHQ